MDDVRRLKLINDFPKLYKNRQYFECCDGWFNIIYDLSKKLEEIIEKQDLQDCHAVQVKEKFGTLRFYMSTETPEMSILINQAEDLSEETCELCSMPGGFDLERKRGAWLQVLCDECRSKTKPKSFS